MVGYQKSTAYIFIMISTIYLTFHMCILLVTSFKSPTSAHVRLSPLTAKLPKKISDDVSQAVTKPPKIKSNNAVDSGASGDSIEFNEVQAKEFSIQLEKLVASSAMTKEPRRSSMYQMSEAVNKQKRQAQDNLKELKALAEKMQWPVTTKETKDYSDDGMFKDYKAMKTTDFDNNADVMSLASSLMNDVQEQAAVAGETDTELETAWNPASVSSYDSLAKDARDRLLKSLLEGLPASNAPLCPQCSVPASEDDLAYFGKCSICRQRELTENVPMSEPPMYVQSSHSKYTPVDVRNGAARMKGPPSSYSQIDERINAMVPVTDARAITVDNKASASNKQPKAGTISSKVQQPGPSVATSGAKAGVWPDVDESMFRDAVDVDGRRTEDLYALISDLETEVKRLRAEIDRLYDNDVGSRVDQVIALVEDLEQSVASSSLGMKKMVETIVETFLAKKKSTTS